MHQQKITDHVSMYFRDTLLSCNQMLHRKFEADNVNVSKAYSAIKLQTKDYGIPYNNCEYIQIKWCQIKTSYLCNTKK